MKRLLVIAALLATPALAQQQRHIPKGGVPVRGGERLAARRCRRRRRGLPAHNRCSPLRLPYLHPLPLRLLVQPALNWLPAARGKLWLLRRYAGA